MKIVIAEKSTLGLKIRGASMLIGERKLPLSMCDMLILGGDVALSSSVLTALAKHNVALLCQGRKHFSLSLPYPGALARHRLLQFSAQQARLEVARHIVSEKMRRHCAAALFHAFDLRAWLQKADDAPDIAALTGVEGAFAKAWFGIYFAQFDAGLHKGRRSKRPPQDPVNAMLSYLYTLVYHLLTVRITAYGFDPMIGYLHEPFRDHCAFSSDLLEFYRADINLFVLQLFAEKSLEKGDFYKKEGVYLRTEARKRVYPQIRELLARIGDDALRELRIFREVLHEKTAACH